jgi:hypothetical protein
MAFIENVGLRKVGFVVYGNEYAAMPKMLFPPKRKSARARDAFHARSAASV